MFFQEPLNWKQAGNELVDGFINRFGNQGLSPEKLALVVVRDNPSSGQPCGYVFNGDWHCYPCSLVKVFHLVNVLSAIEAGRLAPDTELDRAIVDMIVWSSNTATNYVIDVLTETTGNTLLEDSAMREWMNRRYQLNRFFTQLHWPEVTGFNISQKLMDDTRYGREAKFAGLDGNNLNVLTPLAVARLFWALFNTDLPLNQNSQKRAQDILFRDHTGPEAGCPAYQIRSYLSERLSRQVSVWSKAGHNSWTGDSKTSYYKHDAIRIETDDGHELLVVLMTQGQNLAENAPDVFPEIGLAVYERFMGIELSEISFK